MVNDHFILFLLFERKYVTNFFPTQMTISRLGCAQQAILYQYGDRFLEVLRKGNKGLQQ